MSLFLNTFKDFHCFYSEFIQVKQVPLIRNLQVLMVLNTHLKLCYCAGNAPRNAVILTTWLRSHCLECRQSPAWSLNVLWPSSLGIFSTEQDLLGFTRRWTEALKAYGCSQLVCRFVTVSLNMLMCLLESMKYTWMNKEEVLPPWSFMTKVPF